MDQWFRDVLAYKFFNETFMPQAIKSLFYIQEDSSNMLFVVKGISDEFYYSVYLMCGGMSFFETILVHVDDVVCVWEIMQSGENDPFEDFGQTGKKTDWSVA